MLTDCIDAVRAVNSRMDEVKVITEPLVKSIQSQRKLQTREVKVLDSKHMKSNVQIKTIGDINEESQGKSPI